MHAVLAKLSPSRRGDAHPPITPAVAPARDAPPEQNEPLRQSSVDPRIHLTLSKALEPSSVQFVMKGATIEKIGHGQYPIYKAVVTILGKSKVVAVKVFEKDDREDFEKEVAVQSKMRHPCLLTLIGWCEKEEGCCLVMPFKKGGDLRHMIYDQSIALPLVTLIPIFEDVLRGLRFLHSRNILHRDLKPENILLNKARTRAKISDFGTTRQSANAMTVFAVGTVEYCAPEVFHSEVYDSAVDIFSLGMIIWECVTRTKPWAELKQPLALKVEKKLTAGERPIIPTSTPVLIRELITQCWAYKPEERPTAEELLLRHFLRIKEQLCPELIARQQVRPQFGLERGRAAARPIDANPPPGPSSNPLMQSRYMTERHSDDGPRVTGSWIAVRRTPLPSPVSSPSPIPAAAEPLAAARSATEKSPLAAAAESTGEIGSAPEPDSPLLQANNSTSNGLS